MGARSIRAAALILAAAIPGGQVAAQDALPDPATIDVPDIAPSADPKVQKEGYKFFFFHNPAVNFAEAYADIAECRSFLVRDGVTTLPTFRPWVEPVKRKPQGYGAGSYGLVGAAMASIIVPKLERGQRNNKLRRCMQPRGYARYPIAETDWDRLNDGAEATLVAMQAKLASGPKPATKEVGE